MNDDVFMLKPNGWIKEFAKLYKERNKFTRLVVTLELVQLKEDIIALKDAGMAHVWMGVECGDEITVMKFFKIQLMKP